jgi:hypothetical protein
MANLKIDKRGYPVPWFVGYLNGEPEFRAMDQRKFISAIRQKRCWTCGGDFHTGFSLETFVFVIGPMCAVNRISSEPPSHMTCAQYAAKNCPFLARPHMVRREDDLSRELMANVAGRMISRNPGVALLWPTTEYTLVPDAKGKMLIQIGPLTQPAQWWCEGRPATRAEVLHSIETGVPLLRDTIQLERPEDRARAEAQLDAQVQSALKLIPAA